MRRELGGFFFLCFLPFHGSVYNEILGGLKPLTRSHRCKNYRLANFFPARAVAAGCLFVVLTARGLQIPVSTERWLDDITSGKVDMEDFDEVLVELRGLSARD